LNFEEITKEDLIGCIRKERKYQKKLYEKTYPKLMAVAYRLCSQDRELAQDLLSDSYIKIFKKIKHIDVESSSSVSIYVWCKKVLTNSIYDHYRKTKRFSEEPIENIVLSSEDEVEFNYMKYQDLSISDIIDSMKVLSPQYRLVFEMCLVDGKSHKEVGEALNISEGTSKSNLHKAKKAIKEELLLVQKEKRSRKIAFEKSLFKFKSV